VRLLKRDLPRRPKLRAGGSFLPLRGARWARFIANLLAADFFQRPLPSPPPLWPPRDEDRPSAAWLAGVAVMQSLKVKHGAIIRRDISRLSLSPSLSPPLTPFLTLSRFLAAGDHQARPRDPARYRRKVRWRDIRFARHVLPASLSRRGGAPLLSPTR